MPVNKAKPPPSLNRLLELYDYNSTTGHFLHKTRHGLARKGAVAGTKRFSGYIIISVDGVEYLGHRLAWFICKGTWPDMIDHKNRIRSDNWIDNLREIEHHQNQANHGGWPLDKKKYKLPHGVRNYIGYPNRYIAEIKVNYKKKHLGCFDSIEEAEEAFKKAAAKYFGEFAPK